MDSPDLAEPPCSCTEGARRCIGTEVQVCERATPACASWSPGVACATGMCKDGSCGGTCQDACTAGAGRCISDTQRQVCRLTGSGCLDWVLEACPGAQYCSVAQCVDSLPCSVTCPSGYTCSRSGVCAGGNPKALDVNVQVVDVTGTVTLNGATPARRSAECSASVNADQPKGYVRFVENTRGYEFALPLDPCKAATTAFSGKIYPGTYRVTVQGGYNYFSPGGPLSELPTQQYLADPALVVSGAVSDKVLNVLLLNAAGSVTLNGATPARRSAECSTMVNADQPKGSVRFVESIKGYEFSLPLDPCKAASTAFSGKIFPGTYRVTVQGGYNYFSPGGPLSELPIQPFLADAALVVSSAVSGKVLNVLLLDAAGSVTLNGGTPARRSAECSTSVNPDQPKGSVRFVESTKGYEFSLPLDPCKAATTAFSGKIYPGTYRVTVQGAYNYFSPGGPLSELPTQQFLTDTALVVSSAVSGKVLNVLVVDAAGSVTLNGVTPARRSAECSASVNPDQSKGSVRLLDSTRGYEFSLPLDPCKAASTAFSGKIYPGTYRVTVQGGYNYFSPGGPLSELPIQPFLADAALVVSSAVSGKVLNVLVVSAAGSVTLNGATPARSSAECSTSVNPDQPKGSVRFVESTKGYEFSLPLDPCQMASTAFSGKIFPGTYRVTVQGGYNYFSPGGPLCELPTQQFLADTALVVSGAVSAKVLNVLLLDVAGAVTLNGATPARRSAECSASVNADQPKGYVRFVESTKGYEFSLPLDPCKLATAAYFGKLFPGTYRVTVQGGYNYFSPGGPLCDLPTQQSVVADRLQLP